MYGSTDHYIMGNGPNGRAMGKTQRINEVIEDIQSICCYANKAIQIRVFWIKSKSVITAKK